MTPRSFAAVALAPLSAVAEGAKAAVPATGSSLGGVVLSLALVLGLIFVLGWVLRRLQFGRSGGGPLLGVVSQVALGPRDRVVLLRIGDRQALVGVSPAGIRSLQLLDRDIVLPTAEAGTAPDFAGRLRELVERGRG